MKVRRAALAGEWYEGSRAGCIKALKLYTDFKPPADLGQALGGIVPHAGWVFSGATAGKTFAAIRASGSPETFIMFGAVHHAGINVPSIDSNDAWDTPLGEIQVDAELRSAILAEGGKSEIVENEAALRPRENSLELQMPFVKYLFPDARIVPIGVPPVDAAAEAGKIAAIAAAKIGRRVAFIGSSDLTHYGENYGIEPRGPLPAALPWMKENDRRIISLVEQMNYGRIVIESETHYNACGGGAIAAATAAAAESGATGARLLEYTTSMEVAGDNSSGSAVGYASIVFCKK
jgi:MEMO1 family protein